MRKRERMNLHKRGRRLGGTQHREAHSARADASFKSKRALCENRKEWVCGQRTDIQNYTEQVPSW